MPSSRRGFLQGVLGAGAVVAVLPEAAKAANSPEGVRAAGANEVRLDCWVNGAAQALPVDPDDSALHLLRDTLGLTGTKEGCGHGACGACTVLVNGTTVASCLLPATSLQGKKVDTIESFGAPGKLHPVQRAFIAEDALQCGYCTPGFVTESIAFYSRWRAERGTDEPTRDDIASALAGHLCRCGAYDAIYKAVAGACAGRFDAAEVEAARVDAVEKVTGAAKYTVDVALSGMLHGRLFRSPIPHGRVTRLDLEPARKVEGVRAVVSLLAEKGRVRFVGQEIAAVAADTREAAEAGVRAIVMEIQPLPAAVSGSEARAADAPVIFGSDKEAPNSSEFPMAPLGWTGNLRGPLRPSVGMAQGAADRAHASEANHHVFRTYNTDVQAHTTLEPHAVVCHWHDGGLEVWLSTQCVDDMADDIAEVAELTRNRVRVHAEYVGGGFGGKGGFDAQILACIQLAKVAQRPVRMLNDRAEEIAYGGGRPAVEAVIQLSATRDGKPAGLSVEVWNDGGACVGNSTGMMYRLLYPFKEKRIAEWDVSANAPIARAMRGPGGPAALFVLESTMDAMAAELGKTPLALRRDWDASPLRQRLYDRVEALPWWAGQVSAKEQSGRFRKGVGLAAGAWPYFLTPSTQISLTLEAGKLTAASATQDMGNGTRTVIAEAIARRLGVPRALITVVVGDSSLPHGPMSAGSRTTASVGPAATDAADELAEALIDVAERAFSLSGARAVPGGIEHAGGKLDWAQVFAVAPRITRIGKRKRDPAGLFLPFVIADVAVGNRLSAGVQAVEVEVDTALGRVRVTRSWTGIAAGKMVSPLLARSQVCGGVIQGIGYAIHEDRRIDRSTGRIVTANLEDYRIPGMGEIPELEVHFDEEGFEDVLGGGIGMSELCTVPVAAAIGNAVYAATGWAPHHLPLRPDRVLLGMEGMRA